LLDPEAGAAERGVELLLVQRDGLAGPDDAERVRAVLGVRLARVEGERPAFDLLAVLAELAGVGRGVVVRSAQRLIDVGAGLRGPTAVVGNARRVPIRLVARHVLVRLAHELQERDLLPDA